MARRPAVDRTRCDGIPGRCRYHRGQASVIDGATLDIHGQRIRTLDIDAPESRQLCTGADGVEYRRGQKVALALDDWIADRPVTCETTKLDRYKRHLARCSAAGVGLAEWLAENGLAVAYRDCKCEVVRDAAGLVWRGAGYGPALSLRRGSGERTTNRKSA